MKFAEVSKWFNAIAQAYNMGDTPFAYDNGVSVAVQVYNDAIAMGLDPDEAVVTWAIENGISLSKHRPARFK